ncbi:MAG: type III-B CRISPR module-associated Cmr3 family protein [Sulfuritalea sp.]|nr:type III-B CRISPR module-associated Cmr3 family protein [Sulfuritalea sp.]
MTTLFLEPLDVLYLRGNQHFGAAGAHGAALMPPWPSLAAGAIRSRLIAEGETVNTLSDFRLTHFGLAQTTADGHIEALLPLPADVMVTSEALDDARYATPTALPASVASSHALPQLPVFCLDKPVKPIGGLWLNAAGIAAWQAGTPLAARHLLRSNQLWQLDARLGIALDAQTRSAADGKIYTTEAVALHQGVGFVACYEGAPALPQDCLVRLGGDGRGAVVRTPTFEFPQPDWARIVQERRFRLLLTTPGLFADGWKPAGIPATLVAASVNRADTISGWDVLTNQPKAAQRVAPAGSVYWFDDFTGDLAALQTLAQQGLPPADPARRAEGFGKLAIAAWPR